MGIAKKLLRCVWRPIDHGVRPYCAKIMQSLVKFPVAKIEDGKNKYMMAHVYIHGDMGNAKTVIRTSAKAKYHIDIYDALQAEAHKLGLCTQGLGGGYLVHDAQNKYIKIYGRSQLLGKANHEDAREILQPIYGEHKIDAETGGMEA
ncbi:hypothetical protein KR018_006722 [Drosophila ironensis]|nr:hypothetical protein KR018_006722 [Drosophila ironensis]